MAVLYILAIIGLAVTVAILSAVIGARALKKPKIPETLFEDIRGDLRQLQGWYFSQRRYEDTEKVSRMLKELDGLWAAYDMNNVASPVDNKD